MRAALLSLIVLSGCASLDHKDRVAIPANGTLTINEYSDGVETVDGRAWDGEDTATVFGIIAMYLVAVNVGGR